MKKMMFLSHFIGNSDIGNSDMKITDEIIVFLLFPLLTE